MSKEIVEAKVLNDRDTLQALISGERMQAAITAILPEHLSAGRVVKMALIAASRQPKLFECTQASVLDAIMRACELGLDFSGTLGAGYLVPYYNSRIQKSEAQFIPGYQGLMELAYRSDQVDNIEAHVVHSNDDFTYQLGTEPRLHHVPNMVGDRGDFICVYAIANLKGRNKPQVEVMTKDDVNKVRDGSKASAHGPWSTHYDEMARKTVIRRLIKFLPKSPAFRQLQRAWAIENEAEGRTEYVRPTVGPGESSVKMLAERMKANNQQTQEQKQEEVVPTVEQLQ